MSTPEQQVRDILERMGYEDAQSLSAGDVVEFANIIAENTRLEQAVAEKTDKVNALWIENQTLLKQLNEAQQQANALYERHKHLDVFLSDKSLPPIGKTGLAILHELFGFVKRAANGEAS